MFICLCLVLSPANSDNAKSNIQGTVHLLTKSIVPAWQFGNDFEQGRISMEDKPYTIQSFWASASEVMSKVYIIFEMIGDKELELVGTLF